MNRSNNFIFYSSFFDSIENLPEEERENVAYAIVKYGVTGTLPKKMSASLKVIFPLIKPNIDNSIRRYSAQCENGKKGGRPKKIIKPNITQIKANNNPNETQIKPNNNPNETELITNQKPKQNLYKEKYKEKYKENYKYNEDQHQKEINKEKDLNVVDVENENKKFYFDFLSEKLNERSDIFDFNTFCRITKLLSNIYESENFIISNEKISAVDVLSKFVYIFTGTNEEVVNRFNDLFCAIDNAKNVNNKFKYEVSTFYQFCCSNYC